MRPCLGGKEGGSHDGNSCWFGAYSCHIVSCHIVQLRPHLSPLHFPWNRHIDKRIKSVHGLTHAYFAGKYRKYYVQTKFQASTRILARYLDDMWSSHLPISLLPNSCRKLATVSRVPNHTIPDMIAAETTWRHMSFSWSTTRSRFRPVALAFSAKFAI